MQQEGPVGNLMHKSEKLENTINFLKLCLYSQLHIGFHLQIPCLCNCRRLKSPVSYDRSVQMFPFHFIFHQLPYWSPAELPSCNPIQKVIIDRQSSLTHPSPELSSAYPLLPFSDTALLSPEEAVSQHCPSLVRQKQDQPVNKSSRQGMRGGLNEHQGSLWHL